MTSIRKQTESNESTHNKNTNTHKQKQECGECGGNLKHNEADGEHVCEDCGLVVEQKTIDRGPEWRSFNDDQDKKSRVGAPVTKTMHDKGLSTKIGWQDKDSYGNSLSSKKREQVQRLRKWNKRFETKNSKERNLKHALGEIKRMSSALGLSEQVEETASVLYRRCLNEDLLRGRSVEGVATACLYAASRQCNTPRSLDEIYPVSRIGDASGKTHQSTSGIDRTYRYIMRELGLKIKPTDPRDFLNRILNDLGVDNKQAVRKKAEDIISDAEQENVHSGKSPVSLAAASIYGATLLLNQKVTQRRISEEANVTTVTIRNRYQEMLEAYEAVEF